MQLRCYDGGDKIDSAAPAVDLVQIRPAAIDLHVGFIHVPRQRSEGCASTSAAVFHFRRITLNPAVNRGGSTFLRVQPASPAASVTDAVFAVPAYGPQNDVTLKMPAFEWVSVQLHQQKDDVYHHRLFATAPQKNSLFGIKSTIERNHRSGGKAERFTWHKAWTMVSIVFSISYTSRICAPAAWKAALCCFNDTELKPPGRRKPRIDEISPYPIPTLLLYPLSARGSFVRG